MFIVFVYSIAADRPYQVMIPAYEGLLPLEHNQTVLELLFELANWHALAKLRLHTEVTVDIFESATDHMYDAMRRFAETTCAEIEVYEHDDEVDARVRRERQKNPAAQVSNTPKKKEFNVTKTYKYHAAGHCAAYIRRAGPLDNYSTQTVSICSLRSMSYY